MVHEIVYTVKREGREGGREGGREREGNAWDRRRPLACNMPVEAENVRICTFLSSQLLHERWVQAKSKLDVCVCVCVCACV